ncbi:MAG TPA: tRNA pseudouridine(38-40) synthase TruA [Pirellulales bacterium]
MFRTRTIKLTLAYDGTEFAGWQFQTNQRTVQDTLEQTLAKITGKFARVSASGRTDAGVHALAQIVSFETECALPTEVLWRALNAELPRDMAAIALDEVPAGFHAQKKAKRKRYRYVICDGRARSVVRQRYAWQTFIRLDVPAMQRAATALVGFHDFSSFQGGGSQRETTARKVFDLSLRRLEPPDGDVVELEIEADGFLYNMVRNIVGTLIEVGLGKRPESWVKEVLDSLDRRCAGQTAPPQGLFLVHVEY